MKYYFTIQFIRFKRWLLALGIHPVLAYLLGTIIFIGISRILFFKTEIAHWVYFSLAIMLLLHLTNDIRNNKLRIIFSQKKYLLVRTIENLIVALPFQMYLLYEKEYLLSFLLFPIAIIIVFLRSRRYFHQTIPTPFKKFPFEFIVGFRKTFWVIAIAYFLIFKSVQVDNYNLGLFGLAIIFLMSMLYYQKPEPKYFVWIHSDSTTPFLLRKFKIATICVSILSILALLVLIICFPDYWLPSLMVYLCGYVFLGSMIVAKYSAYPHEMNIPQGLFYVMSLLFPPMLLIAIWVFYSKSKKRLEPILE